MPDKGLGVFLSLPWSGLREAINCLLFGRKRHLMGIQEEACGSGEGGSLQPNLPPPRLADCTQAEHDGVLQAFALSPSSSDALPLHMRALSLRIGTYQSRRRGMLEKVKVAPRHPVYWC